MNDVADTRESASPAHASKDRAPVQSIDVSRHARMKRVKHMSIEQRLDLFEQLSRDAAWARGTKRVR